MYHMFVWYNYINELRHKDKRVDSKNNKKYVTVTSKRVFFKL